jgi:hypothetical protein
LFLNCDLRDRFISRSATLRPLQLNHEGRKADQAGDDDSDGDDDGLAHWFSLIGFRCWRPAAVS